LVTNFSNVITSVSSNNSYNKSVQFTELGRGSLNYPAGICLSLDGNNYLVCNAENYNIINVPVPFPTQYQELLANRSVSTYILQTINNGISKSYRGMPQKEINTDGTSSFSTGRRNYVEQSNTTVSVAQYTQKKWIGGNRDGSSVIDRRRNLAIGLGSINAANTPITDKNVDQNLVNRALIRTRNAGGAVPPKCSSRGILPIVVPQPVRHIEPPTPPPTYNMNGTFVYSFDYLVS
jgi:hypothetical protein